METCLRGFSYVPKSKKLDSNLQFIEPDELERVWKASRREKTRQQEDKIFADFVMDEDVVSTVFNDDRYQFLDDFADDSVKQMIEKELNLNKSESGFYALASSDELNEEGQAQLLDAPEKDGQPRVAPQAVVEFVSNKDEDDDDNNMFRIFDDSGPDDTVNNTINGSVDSPCTVRENVDSAYSERDSSLSPTPSSTRKSSKTAKLSSMIESNIYCAKVRDLRKKINDELLRLVNSVERKNLLPMDTAEMKKNEKRAIEFCTRFNRVHMYQVQRQVSDIARHAAVPLPSALHTEFLAQMSRAGSLHQSALHALQVFQKSFDQVAVSQKSVDLLISFTKQLREMHDICRTLPTPPDLTAAAGDLYNDNMLASLDQMEKVGEDFINRLTLTQKTSTDDSKPPTSPKRSPKLRRRFKGKKPAKKPAQRVSDHPLAMYGADPQGNFSAKDAIQSSVKRLYQPPANSGNTAPTNSASTVEAEKEIKPLRSRRSPRRRKPLMRDPHLGRSKSKQILPKDNEIETMVEHVDTGRTENSCCEFAGIISPVSGPDEIHDYVKIEKVSDKPAEKEKGGSPKKPRSPIPSAKAIYIDMLLPKSANQSPRGGGGGNKTKPPTKVKFQDKRSHSARSKVIEPKVNEPKVNEPKANDSKVKDDVVIPPLALNKSNHATVSSGLASSKTKAITKPDKSGESSKKLDKSGESSRKQDKSGESSRKPDKSGESSRKPDKSGESSRDVDKATSPVTSTSKNVMLEEVTEDVREKSEIGGENMQMNPEMKCHECEVSRILKSLCGGDSYGKVTGAKNAQLISMTSSRQPSTPQLLRILEETIQKKVPKQLFNQKRLTQKQKDKLRLALSINEDIVRSFLEYRTKFVQYMIASPLYTNSAVGKPWEVIGSVSEKIIEGLLLKCGKEMELEDVLLQMFKDETEIEEVPKETQQEC